MKTPDSIDPTTPAVVRDATNAQAELHAAYAMFEQCGHGRLQAAIRIGAVLADRKATVGHGGWLRWLESHFPYGRKRAADFLRVHANRAECGRAATFEEALSLCRDEPDPAPEPECNRAVTFDPPDPEPEPEPAPEPDDEPADPDETPLVEPGDDEPGGAGKCNRPVTFGPPAPATPPAGLAPPSGTLPVPRIDAGAKPPHPLYGNRKRPARKLGEHKYGDILVAMRNLSRMLTLAMNAPDGGRLKDYLRFLGLVQDRGFILNGKKYNARFRGFQFRHAVKIAVGKKPPLSKAELLKECLAEWANYDEFGPDAESDHEVQE